VTSLGVLVLETAAVYAAAPTTLGGRLRRLTAPRTGDNRATYLPDGTALLFASSRLLKKGASDGCHPSRRFAPQDEVL
jgi:hypothetical protein